jgi:TadE-like protein
MDRDRGQATIETVAVMPLVALLALAAWQGILIGWTALEAQQAARAGARALLAGERPGRAVGRSLPASMRAGVRVDRSGGRLVVRVPVPGLFPGFHLLVGASAAEVKG